MQGLEGVRQLGEEQRITEGQRPKKAARLDIDGERSLSKRRAGPSWEAAVQDRL